MNSKYSAIALRYHALPQKTDYVMLRYIWLDGNGYDLRTKSNYAKFEPKTVEEVPLWCYCGQTCGHMKLTANSDCWLKPVLLCNDPFREQNNKLVFCVPIKYQIEASIHRNSCESLLLKRNDSNKPIFNIRQTFIIMNPMNKKPIGWPYDDFNSVGSTYNMSVGANKSVGRDIDEAFYKACLYAGLPISVSQVDDIPSMWNFHLGPTRGLSIGDELWMARFILNYIGEQFNCVISFEPLKQNQSIHQSLDIWTEDKPSEGMSFPSNSDPYNAIQAICK